MSCDAPNTPEQRPEVVQVEQTYGVGFLGATISSDVADHPQATQAARDEMIERRILRIEMALRRAGIEVEVIELPRVASHPERRSENG